MSLSSKQLRRRRLAWRLITVAAYLMTALAALLGGLVAGVYSSMTDVLPPPGDIAAIHPAEGLMVYSADGELLGQVARERREFLPITRIPSDLQLASIAVEDRRFYRHHGVDPRGVMAAARDNILGGRIVRGGSTITQQLARNVYLSPRRTFARKLQEMLLALQIEHTFAKEEILELYLNQIYYGHGAYGVQVAAETYFDKPVDRLSLAQCALMAGIPQRPRDYDPFANLDAAKRRRSEVLSRMREQGYISAPEAEQAQLAPLGLGKPKPPAGVREYRAPYFTSYVLRQLVSEYGADAIYRSDCKVFTTLNWEMQQAAERAVRKGVENARGRHVGEGALVAIDWRSGAIKALVGGLDYNKDQYSCATQARRQAGSAFKVFLYTAAMDSGYTPDSVFVDAPVSYRGAGSRPWRPHNAEPGHRGPMRLRSALVHSVNVVAVKLMEKVGVQKVIEYAHRMGIRDPLDPYLSLALGTSGVTALDMASAFGVLANGGRRVEPRAVDRITDRKDNVIMSYDPQVHQVLSSATAATMDDMMRDVITRGTGTGARIAWPAAGKTGTASDYKDAWFIGYTDDLVCAVWVGNRDNSPMRRIFGGTAPGGPAGIWKDFMTRAMRMLRGYDRPGAPAATGGQTAVRERRAPPEPVAERPRESRTGATPAAGGQTTGAPGTITLSICADSGKLATDYCPHVINKSFAPSEAPTATCKLHRPPPADDTGAALW